MLRRRAWTSLLGRIQSLSGASMNLNKRFYTEIEVSGMIGASLPTLCRWRLESRGPKVKKFGSLVRYGDHELAEWITAQPSGGTQISLTITAASTCVSVARTRRKTLER